MHGSTVRTKRLVPMQLPRLPKWPLVGTQVPSARVVTATTVLQLHPKRMNCYMEGMLKDSMRVALGLTQGSQLDSKCPWRRNGIPGNDPRGIAYADARCSYFFKRWRASAWGCHGR